MKITIVFGDWSRNIGNAFFQLGGAWILEQVFPEEDIALISDQPGYPSYWNPKGGNPNGYFDMSRMVKPDYLCLVGPIFRPEMEKIWGKTLNHLLGRTKLILLGVAAMSYQSEHIKLYRKFLTKYKPSILVSRDAETYEKLGDLAEVAYDGIDLGFFLPEIYQPESLRSAEPYVVLNFDKLPEPSISISKHSDVKKPSRFFMDRDFKFRDMHWSIRFRPFQTGFALRSRYAMFLEGMLFGGKNREQNVDLRIIRTDHRPHPMLRWKTYRYSNVLVNDTPYPYIEVYSQAELVLSNRMHACVASAAFGRPSMLFSESPRIRLLERLGLGEIRQTPMLLDQHILKEEKENLIAFLKKVVP